MTTRKGNGLDAANDQPAKRLTKYAIYYIARCRLFASGFYLEKGIDAGLIVAFSLVLLGVALIGFWRLL